MKTFQKPLTSGEEAMYIRLLKEGSAEEARLAKEILVERNLRLVAHIAKKYTNVDEDMEDLISIGCIGLIKAVNTFDAGKGRLAEQGDTGMVRGVYRRAGRAFRRPGEGFHHDQRTPVFSRPWLHGRRTCARPEAGSEGPGHRGA